MKYVQMTLDMLGIPENVGGYGKPLHYLKKLKNQKRF